MANKEELKAKFATGQAPTGDDFEELINTVGEQGPQGAPGQDGQDGAKGADGFPTEEQWNELVARVDALESQLNATE